VKKLLCIVALILIGAAVAGALLGVIVNVATGS
jgi:hypothetical protein